MALSGAFNQDSYPSRRVRVADERDYLTAQYFVYEVTSVGVSELIPSSTGELLHIWGVYTAATSFLPLEGTLQHDSKPILHFVEGNTDSFGIGFEIPIEIDLSLGPLEIDTVFYGAGTIPKRITILYTVIDK